MLDTMSGEMEVILSDDLCSKQMFRIVWIETNDMDGLQAVGDRRCDISDFGRIHLTTAILSHELNRTH